MTGSRGRVEEAFRRAEDLRERGYLSGCRPGYRAVLKAGFRRDPEIWLESCLGLAAAERSLGEVQRARAAVSAGLARARSSGRDEYVERLELEAALIDRARGRYGRSLKALEGFLARFRARRDWAAAGFVLWAMGGARRFSGDLKGSQRDFLASLACARKARDEAGMAYALFGLGGVVRIQGRLPQAESYYLRAGRILKGSRDLFGLAYAHCGLANVLRQRGVWAQARRHYRLSHALYSRLGDVLDLAYVDWGLGQVAMRTGDLKDARRLLERARAAFARGREARGVALSEHSLAALLHAQGRTAAGEALFDKAVRRARAAGLHAHLEIFT